MNLHKTAGKRKGDQCEVRRRKAQKKLSLHEQLVKHHPSATFHSHYNFANIIRSSHLRICSPTLRSPSRYAALPTSEHCSKKSPTAYATPLSDLSDIIDSVLFVLFLLDYCTSEGNILQ
ncbi:hypothetical protein AB6A40_005660 [Gnathostoma spinigerum]|uniref:Uncharacterized protein n=1 Tax=Gnathostoma spinigerum TaxID=75299 RepID=A0ABD6EGW0_9BILA